VPLSILYLFVYPTSIVYIITQLLGTIYSLVYYNFPRYSNYKKVSSYLS